MKRMPAESTRSVASSVLTIYIQLGIFLGKPPEPSISMKRYGEMEGEGMEEQEAREEEGRRARLGQDGKKILRHRVRWGVGSGVESVARFTEG
jgi:hypothetical protein